MVVTIVAGVAYAKVRTPTYEATAVLQLQGLQTGQATSGGSSTAVTAPTALDDPPSLLATPAVANGAAKLLQVGSPADIAATVSGALDTVGTQFSITATGKDPQEVAEVANAFAASYIVQSSKVVDAAISTIQDQIDTLSTQITQLQASSKAGDPAATAELQAASAELTNLYAEKTALSVNGPNYAQFQHRAQVPATSSGLSNSKIALLSALVGLFAGSGIALARSQLDTRLRSRQELEEIAGFPILAELPNDRRGRGRHGRLETPGPALSEALRELRTTLQVALEDKPCPVVLVTSPSPGDGKTMLVSTLGAAWASGGRRVVVVSADLRRPQLEDALGVADRQPGLRDLAALDRRDADAPAPWPLDEAPPAEGADTERAASASRPLPDRDAVAGALIPTDVPGLAVLPCGGHAQNPSELLGSPAMHAVMDRLVGLADLVILDTPPVLAVSDAAELARQVDGVVLVASEGKSSRDEVEQAIARLSAVKAQLIGVVLNRVRRAQVTSYQQYYETGGTAADAS
jgi:Mrp family chromosome partitioning ATPase/capsular polysaccharide biosynthesis protein